MDHYKENIKKEQRHKKQEFYYFSEIKLSPVKMIAPI